jgi:hypothetical protein
VRLLGLVCLSLTTVALLLGLVQAARLRTQVEEVRSALIQSELGARSATSPTGVTASVVTPAQADAMNEVVDRLNVPWAHLLNDLETLTPPTIAVLQMEPLVAASGGICLPGKAARCQNLEASQAHQVRNEHPGSKPADPLCAGSGIGACGSGQNVGICTARSDAGCFRTSG